MQVNNMSVDGDQMAMLQNYSQVFSYVLEASPINEDI